MRTDQDRVRPQGTRAVDQGPASTGEAQLQAKHEAAYIIFDALAFRKQSDEILELLQWDEPTHQIPRRLTARHNDGIDGGSSDSTSTSTREDPTGGMLSPTSPRRTILASSPGESTLTSPSNPEHPPPHQRIEDVPDVVPIGLKHGPQLTSAVPSPTKAQAPVQTSLPQMPSPLLPCRLVPALVVPIRSS